MRIRFSLLRLAALALLVYSLVMFTSSVERVYTAENTVAALRREYERARLENLELSARLERAKSGADMEALARERLGLVKPGERVFYFTLRDGAMQSSNTLTGDG